MRPAQRSEKPSLQFIDNPDPVAVAPPRRIPPSASIFNSQENAELGDACRGDLAMLPIWSWSSRTGMAAALFTGGAGSHLLRRPLQASMRSKSAGARPAADASSPLEQ